MQRLWNLEKRFPKLANAGYQKTSEQTGRPPKPGAYNCIAWAASDPRKKLWWWPDPNAYWPFWIKPRNETIECFVTMFRCLGYTVCSHSRRQFGFEKVALYAMHKSGAPMPPPESLVECADWIPKHMARQLRDGTWSSKLGGSEDITHFTLDALESYGPVYLYDEYGCPIIYMRRFVVVSWIVRCVQHIVWKLQP
jgi:hypothetical protein